MKWDFGFPNPCPDFEGENENEQEDIYCVDDVTV